MNKNSDWKKTEEIEIDLADLLRKLLMQWKQIILCALAFALLAGGYSYIRNRSSIDVTDKDAAEDVELTEEELQSVTSAVELHGDIKMQEEYMECSVLMKADPYHKHKIYMLYSIDQAKRQDIQKITESYLNFLGNGGAAGELKKSGSKEWDMDKSYLTELITAYQKNYDSPYQEVIRDDPDGEMLAESLFYIEVTGQDDKQTQKLAGDIRSVLKKQYAKVRKQAGSHKLTLLSTEHNILADSNLLAQQRDKKSQLAANAANLKAMTDAFSDAQMAVYLKEAEIEDEKQEKGGSGKEDAAESMKEDGDAAGSGISVKYIILGLFGGIFVYCGIFGCWYLFRDTVKSEEEMKNLYTFPFYGGIPFGNQADECLVNRIRLACKKQGITELCAASDFAFDAQEKECMEGLAKQLEGFGIHTVIAENASGSAALWDILAETGNVLMVCRIGTTTHRMIDDGMRFYRENGISVTGAMAFHRKK